MFFERNGRRIDPIGLATRFVTLEHDTPLLLPSNLRDWVPAAHLANLSSTRWMAWTCARSASTPRHGVQK